eukprot:11747164-Karenia_brevis.AAC.1
MKAEGHDGDGTASMRTHATPAKSFDHVADGLAPTGHARPEYSEAGIYELGEKAGFLPTHMTSNPRPGQVFTVEMHHQQ